MNKLSKNISKILIVDDTPDNIQLLSDILSEEGINITIARNGKQAIKSISIKLPDLILLDIAMPEMDGFEVCEHLKKDSATADIPIIFLTAKTETEDIVKGFELGAVDYITKPFNVSELIARVNTHLDLKHSQDIIKEQNERLKQLDATKDKFFSIIASDLRNPLKNMSEIIQNTAGMLDKLQPVELKRIIANLQIYSGKANSLIERLTEWAIILTDRIQFKPKKFDIDLLIKLNIEHFKTATKDKTINLLYEKPKTTMVFADYNLTDTILKNLIGNAIKYTSAGGDIIVSIKEDNSKIEINVYDTGIGISNEEKTFLFRKDLFYSQPGTDGEKGIGLGLIICKTYVEMQGGKIWLDSMPGIGSDFKFTLPK